MNAVTEQAIDSAAQLIAQAMANAGADMIGDTRELARQVLMEHPAIRTSEVDIEGVAKEPGYLYEANRKSGAVWRIPSRVVEDALMAQEEIEAKKYPEFYSDPHVWHKRPVSDNDLHDWLGNYGEDMKGWELVYSPLPEYEHLYTSMVHRDDGEKIFPLGD